MLAAENERLPLIITNHVVLHLVPSFDQFLLDSASYVETNVAVLKVTLDAASSHLLLMLALAV